MMKGRRNAAQLDLYAEGHRNAAPLLNNVATSQVRRAKGSHPPPPLHQPHGYFPFIKTAFLLNYMKWLFFFFFQPNGKFC